MKRSMTIKAVQVSDGGLNIPLDLCETVGIKSGDRVTVSTAQTDGDQAHSMTKILVVQPTTRTRGARG